MLLKFDEGHGVLSAPLRGPWARAPCRRASGPWLSPPYPLVVTPVLYAPPPCNPRSSSTTVTAWPPLSARGAPPQWAPPRALGLTKTCTSKSALMPRRSFACWAGVRSSVVTLTKNDRRRMPELLWMACELTVSMWPLDYQIGEGIAGDHHLLPFMQFGHVQFAHVG